MHARRTWLASSSPVTSDSSPSTHERSDRISRTGAPFALVPLLLVLLLAASACGSSSPSANVTGTPQPVTLKVFAADSLTAVFTKLGNQFHTLYPNVTMSFNFAGSNTLATQINQGAPADVFASANLTQMNVVVAAGGISSSSVQVFAHNHIIVILPKSNPGNIQTLQDLAKPGVKIVLGASSVPAGAYALQFLAAADADPSFGSSYKADFLRNVVSYQTDVGGVLSQVTSGDADAGIVYISDAQTDASSLTTITIPASLNPTATYPIGPVKSSANASTAAEFIAYVLSSGGQSVLTSFGFLSATDGPGYTYSPPPTATP